MTRKIFFVGILAVVMVILAACGTAAKPAYDPEAIIAQAQETVTANQGQTEEIATEEATEVVTEAVATEEATEVVTEAVATEVVTEAVATEEVTEVVTEAVATEEATEAVATEEATEVVTEAVATEEATTEASSAQTGTEETIAVEDDPLFEAVSVADAANGQQLFLTNGCVGCHSVDASGMTIVGPGQWGLINRAMTRVAGVGPYSYIFNSIIHPNDYVVEGFSPNIMPQNFRDLLTDEQIYNIIAYMITLHD